MSVVQEESMTIREQIYPTGAIDPNSAEAQAAKWWHEDGREIDPDSHCGDWYVKRRELAQIGFVAGFKACLCGKIQEPE